MPVSSSQITTFSSESILCLENSVIFHRCVIIQTLIHFLEPLPLLGGVLHVAMLCVGVFCSKQHEALHSVRGVGQDGDSDY